MTHWIFLHFTFYGKYRQCRLLPTSHTPKNPPYHPETHYRILGISFNDEPCTIHLHHIIRFFISVFISVLISVFISVLISVHISVFISVFISILNDSLYLSLYLFYTCLYICLYISPSTDIYGPCFHRCCTQIDLFPRSSYTCESLYCLRLAQGLVACGDLLPGAGMLS